MRDVHLRRGLCRTSLLAVGLAATLAAMLAPGCSGESDPTPTVEAAGLRAVHLAPGAPDVAVFLDGDTVPLFEQVMFAGGTPYAPLEAGSYDVSIGPAGVGLQGAILRVSELQLPAETFATLAVIGSPDATDEAPLEVLLLFDELAPAVPGIARVRAVHVAPGLGDVEVRAIPDRGVETAISGPLGYTDVGDYVELSTATHYTFAVDVDHDGELDELLAVDLPFEAIAMNVYVALDAAGAPLLVAQADRGNTLVSELVPRPQDQAQQ